MANRLMNQNISWRKNRFWIQTWSRAEMEQFQKMNPNLEQIWDGTVSEDESKPGAEMEQLEYESKPGAKMEQFQKMNPNLEQRWNSFRRSFKALSSCIAKVV